MPEIELAWPKSFEETKAEIFKFLQGDADSLTKRFAKITVCESGEHRQVVQIGLGYRGDAEATAKILADVIHARVKEFTYRIGSIHLEFFDQKED